MSTFVPLRVRSHGSLLHGVASPESLVDRALALGYGTLALADRDNLYVAIRFWRTARVEGLAPILGVDLGEESSAGPARGAPRAAVMPAAGATGAGPIPARALLLAIDRRGYANLCALITARKLDPRFDLVAALAERHAGLHVIVESTGLAASLLAAGVPAAFGDRGPRPRDGGLWIGVRGIPAERTRLAARLDAARALGVPPVATGDVVMLDARDHEVHAIAVTAAAGELRERMPAGAFAAKEAWLAPPQEWVRRVRAVCAAAGRPEAAGVALANNVALAARCRLELDLDTPILPRAPLPEGVTGAAHLERLVREGLARRYGGDQVSALRRLRAARPRLRDELAIIGKMGFTDYFLLVAEIVGFARSRGIPTVGRGSGASSLVAYALGITNVDPMRYGLTFERFLHPSRRDCPDLDIDLCWKRRDDVIAHVYDTYGHDRVAMICTHATLGARSAFRETAKALGLSNARVNALARRVPRDLEPPYLDRLLAMPEARFVDWREPPLADALRLAERLDAAPRHLSVHSGGLVIADRELTHYVPLERAAKDLVVTQFEMHAIEALGLVKMDLLGNRCLSTLGECLELVNGVRAEPRADAPVNGAATRDTGPPLSLDAIPEDDPATAARLAAGDTLNCFQLESPAMRHLLRMLDCRTLDETIAAVALVRPGPAESGMKSAYCRRQRGLEPVTHLHPKLATVLGDTHGVLLYEEDVIRVAAALTGMSLGSGDDLRRAIGACRTDEEFRSLERGFVAQAVRAGVGAETAGAVWRELTRFAAYAFCKAHAAGYGVLGWQSAYLKTHFPVEYAAGILNHHAGMYPTWVHVDDLRRGRPADAGGVATPGVTFRAPCVARSQWDATLEPVAVRIEPVAVPLGPAADTLDSVEAAEGGLVPAAARDARFAHDAGDRRERAVRVGLSRVYGLAETTGARIVRARAMRPFATLADFLERVRPALPEVEALVFAGALDVLGRSRPTLLLEARVSAPAVARTPPRAPALLVPGGAELAPPPVAPAPVPDLPEFDVHRRVRGEARATGLWFSAHPLDAPELAVARRDTVRCADLPRLVGRRVALVGLTCAYRRVETKRGEPMLFMTIADTSGLAEGTLFTRVYRSSGAARPTAGAAGTPAAVVRLEGRVEEALDAVTLNVDRVVPLDGSAPPRSTTAWDRGVPGGRDPSLAAEARREARAGGRREAESARARGTTAGGATR